MFSSSNCWLCCGIVKPHSHPQVVGEARQQERPEAVQQPFSHAPSERMRRVQPRPAAGLVRVVRAVSCSSPNPTAIAIAQRRLLRGTAIAGLRPFPVANLWLPATLCTVRACSTQPAPTTPPCTIEDSFLIRPRGNYTKAKEDLLAYLRTHGISEDLLKEVETRRPEPATPRRRGPMRRRWGCSLQAPR